VRDLLLSRPYEGQPDIDLVIEGDGVVFARALADRLGGRVREHASFMTAAVLYPAEAGEEQRVDVATARLEYYEYPATLPTVELSSIKMDLFRRDFTINAMAIRLNSWRFGYLVDFFGGQNDIQRKTIHVLHALSFVEDPTRILRAARFAQRYQFRLSGQTLRLIRNAIDLRLIDKLSGHRLLHEFEVIFREKSPLACFEQFDKIGILSAIHPDLKPDPRRRELFARLETVLEWYNMLYLPEKIRIVLLYTLAATHALGNDSAASILERFALPQALRKLFWQVRAAMAKLMPDLAAWYRREGPASALYDMLSTLPIEGVLCLMARAPNQKAKHISLYINRWRMLRPDINGRDLQNMGLAPGPLYGMILREVLHARLDNVVESREEQLALARDLIARPGGGACAPERRA
jgi:tRNA nucleotidyltransferase (CCA-adding enzyme)